MSPILWDFRQILVLMKKFARLWNTEKKFASLKIRQILGNTFRQSYGPPPICMSLSNLDYSFLYSTGVVQGEVALLLKQLLIISFVLSCLKKMTFIFFQKPSLKWIDNCPSGSAPTPCLRFPWFTVLWSDSIMSWAEIFLFVQVL